MKMVIEGKTAEHLAKQLVNPKTNGGKTMKQLIEHADYGLVKIGWDIGEGRTPSPLVMQNLKKHGSGELKLVHMHLTTKNRMAT